MSNFGNRARVLLLSAVASLGTGCAMMSTQESTGMSFFVTSVGIGNGGDLGGLEGADRHCQTLADAAGAGKKTWRAYLSTQGAGAVNARDRIGSGPWRNAKSELIADNLAELHFNNALTKQTALTEKGDIVNGRGDTPNKHDVLTGSQPDGNAFAGEEDRTCGNWRKNEGKGAAIVGHADRTGLNESAPARSWNSSHPSRGPGGGCTQTDFNSTGGDGLFYCFAAK